LLPQFLALSHLDPSTSDAIGSVLTEQEACRSTGNTPEGENVTFFFQKRKESEKKFSRLTSQQSKVQEMKKLGRKKACKVSKQGLDSAQWNGFRMVLHGSDDVEAAGPEPPAAGAGSCKDKPKKQRACPGHSDPDAMPTAHIQLASKYPQKGDEVELLFTKKPRKWVKGKVLSADMRTSSFEVRIEIEDSDEFHAQVNAGCVDSLSKHGCVTGSSVFWYCAGFSCSVRASVAL
jgi:hypothetical protein